jgi:diacylglycerol kinase (ATP)
MKCIFLYNPKSGKGKLLPHINKIHTILRTRFNIVDIYETKSTEDTIAKAKSSCLYYDVIVFAGGDGTFNDITCGVASQPVRPILGYIPSGTVCDIAKNLGIPRNFKKALKVILDGEIVNHDVGKINDSYFMYVAAIGTFTGVSYRTTHEVKKIFGKLAYASDGLKDLINPSLSTIRLKTEESEIAIDTPLLLVMNSISVAGIPFNKNGHLNDGKFDIIVVKKGVYKGILNILRMFILGIFRLSRNRYIEVYRSSKFMVETGGNPQWTIDGEAGPKGSVTIENYHNYLKIYVPKKNSRKKSKNFS